MPYTPTAWADGVTPVNAANLNKIEAALAAASAGGATDLSYKGDYVPGTYNDGDIVVYNGILYMCTKAGIATAPGVFPPPGAQDAIPKSLVDAAGDLLLGTANDVVTRLPKGADGTVLGMAAGAVGWRAMPGQMTLIAQQTLGGDTAQMDFASIPASYTDLLLAVVTKGSGTTGSPALGLRCNDDAAASYHCGTGVGASPAAQTTFGGTGQNVCAVADTRDAAAIWTTAIFEVFNYTDVARYRALRYAAAGPINWTTAVPAVYGMDGAWLNAAAVVTKLSLLLTVGSLKAGSYARLYGRA